MFDLVVTLIFLLFLSMQKCSDPQVNNSSSQIYNYDNNKIDGVFKKIVENQLYVDGFSNDSLTDAVSVTYSDTSSSFNLNLVVSLSEKRLFGKEIDIHSIYIYLDFLIDSRLVERIKAESNHRKRVLYKVSLFVK